MDYIVQPDLDDELQQMDEREQETPELVEAVHLDDPLSSLKLQHLELVKPTTTIKEAIDLLSRYNIGCLLVEEEGRLVGVLTERDIIRRVVGKGLNHAEVTVAEYMTKNPDTLRREDPIAFALNRMYERGYRHVPLVDSVGRATGFVSIRDIVNHLAAYYQKEILNLPPRPVRTAHPREGG